MSKRYSESLVQDLNNEPAECLRREWDIMGTKKSHTPSPSSVDRFLCGKTLMKKTRSMGYLSGVSNKCE